MATLSRNHPGLVAYGSAGEVEDGPLRGCLYLSMELAGDSLRTRLQYPSRMPLPDVQQMGRDLADALAYLHSQGAVHRDVKPENLFASGTRWKLGDLGLARAVDNSLVNASDIKGTLEYMAPETFNGLTGPSVDVWSLGAIVQEALSGVLPYDASFSLGELTAAVLTQEPRLVGGLAPPFDAVVRGCLVKDPQRRWTAAQVVETLTPAARAHLAGPPAAAPARNVARVTLDDLLKGYWAKVSPSGRVFSVQCYRDGTLREREVFRDNESWLGSWSLAEGSFTFQVGDYQLTVNGLPSGPIYSGVESGPDSLRSEFKVLHLRSGVDDIDRQVAHSGYWAKVSRSGRIFLVRCHDDGSITEFDIFKPDDQWSGSWTIRDVAYTPPTPAHGKIIGHPDSYRLFVIQVGDYRLEIESKSAGHGAIRYALETYPGAEDNEFAVLHVADPCAGW
jgi:serine/threonine protein kinase